MPLSGVCADSRCDEGVKRLYECHCCLQLICLNHLNEHDEKEKEMQDKCHCLIEQLRMKNDLIRSSIENRLKIIERETIFIERERQFVERANQFLDGQSYPIADIEQILEDFNQLVQTHSSEESIVKVEPVLSDVTNCPSAFQQTNENNNQNDQCSLEMVSSEFKSSTHFDLTEDSEIEYSMVADESIQLNRCDNTLQDNHENEGTSLSFSSFAGCCPLKFDGAFGLSQSKHSIRFCSNEKKCRIKLFGHLTFKHKLKPSCARRLIEAIAKKHDPIITKLFDDNEDIIDRSGRIECPFKKGLIQLFDCHKETNIRRIPCKYQPILIRSLKSHLKSIHHLPDDLAQQLSQYHKDNQAINH